MSFMDCGRVEQLIALHVGGDLAPGPERLVAAHLQTCAGCRRLASDFAASREMLRLHEPPEFDAAFFDPIRRNVLDEIDGAPEQNFFAPFFSRLFVHKALAYAASVALFVVAGALAFTLFGGRMYVVNEPSHTAQSNALRDDDDEPSRAATPSPTQPQPSTTQPPLVAARDGRSAAAAGSATRAGRASQSASPSKHSRATAVESVASVNPPTAYTPRDPSETRAGIDGASPAAQEVAERKMLRIELQTGDPNVRIIWLSPQAADSRQEK